MTIPEVLPRTFTHIPGVGSHTEKLLWDQGITSWSKFLKASRNRDVARILNRTSIQKYVEQSLEAYEGRRIDFFAKHLPRDDWWRLYRSFESHAVYLDIETTGLSQYYDEITLVGLYDGVQTRTFLADHNLEEVAHCLRSYQIVITFNGTLFDLPFLKSKFPHLTLPPVHLDLRYLLRRLGLTGGLKEIEGRLGIKRSKETKIVDGHMATVLWARYRQGDLESLRTLIQYNLEDVGNLKTLIRYCYDHLVSGLLNRPSHNSSAVKSKRVMIPSVKIQRMNGSNSCLVVNGRRLPLANASSISAPISVSDLLKRIPISSKELKIVGIDLRASERRPTGWAALSGNLAETRLLKTDEDIIRETTAVEPDIISIDSPLTLPFGRCCTDDACRCKKHGILRECERILWRRGIRVFPCLLPSMRELTKRGIRLAEAFRIRGYTVIESYPGAAQDIMRIPRKKASREDLTKGLGAFGITGHFLDSPVTHDELDAITSAVVGYFYLAKEYDALGNSHEDFLIVPKLENLVKSLRQKAFPCPSRS